MKDLDKKYCIFIDVKNEGSTNHLCEFFNTKNIVYDYVPESIPGIPLIDQLVHRCDDQKPMLLITNIKRLRELSYEKSSYVGNDFVNLVNSKKIKLIYYNNSDSHLTFYNRKHPLVIEMMKKIKFYWWGDMFFGEKIKNEFKNADFFELSHPYIEYANIHHFFNLLKNKDKDKTFFSLIKLRPKGENEHNRKHRRLLLDGISGKSLCEQAILRTEESNQNSRFSDLEGEYGPVHLKEATMKELLPVPSYYDRTYFELVCETFGELETDDSCFITEKTLKPIMMGHPFIMLSNKNFLKNLRRIGFKTFDGLIDESYDSYDSLADRVNAVVKILEELDIEKSKSFYDNSLEIRKHNQNNLMLLFGRYKFDLWKKLNEFFHNFK